MLRCRYFVERMWQIMDDRSQTTRDWPIDFLRDIEADEAGEGIITSGQARELRTVIEGLRSAVRQLMGESA